MTLRAARANNTFDSPPPFNGARVTSTAACRFLVCLACLLPTTACRPRAEPPGTGSSPDPAADSTPAATPIAPARTEEIASGTGQSADELALRALSDRFVQGLLDGAPDSAASVYSVHAEVFAPGVPELLLGQEAVRAHLRRRLEKLRVLELDVQRSQFVVRPEVAYSFGVWRAVTQPSEGGAPDSSAGRITDVYRRTGAGPWVVSHEHASLLVPAAPAPDSVHTP
ncbi:MAG: nuclear transport factor 2 family protein, partial [Gemmatimonadetes bacterium]|nr:nuclear transport factor 2 family protein [Gemmatimonadota bacterium]